MAEISIPHNPFIDRITERSLLFGEYDDGADQLLQEHNELSHRLFGIGAVQDNPFGGTQGSVLFIGSNSLSDEDNANFFWDDTNNRLGIGTSAPQAPLHVVGADAAEILRVAATNTVLSVKEAVADSAMYLTLGTNAQTNARILAPENLALVFDSANDSTTRIFTVGHDGDVSAPTLFSIAEDGTAIFTATNQMLKIAEVVADSSVYLTVGTNAQTNARLICPESCMIHIDASNDSTTRSFQIIKDTATSAGGTILAFVGEGGDVGINTSSPGVVLGVDITAGINLHVKDGSSPTRLVLEGAQSEILLAETDAAADAKVTLIYTAGGLFKIDRVPDNLGSVTTALIVDSSSRVGVGSLVANITLPSQFNVVDGTGASDRGFLTQTSVSSVAGAAAIFRKSRGTPGSPTIISSGDSLGVFIGRGHDGTTYIDGAAIQFNNDGTPGTNDMPGRIEFYTSPDGSATLAERMRIDSVGNMLFGTTTGPSTGSVGLVFGDGTALATMAANTAGLYADDVGGTVTMHVINENGNVIRLGRVATYTPTNVTTDRSYDANSTTIDEIADVLGSLIADLQTLGFLG